MSKNLTRKGLAFGAVVALSSTLIAGSPAFAASVLFAPTTGTGNTLVAGETFSLTASLSSDLPATNSTQLKFKVANTTGVAATVTLNSKTLFAAAASAAHGAGASVVTLDASVGGTTAASALASGTASAVYGIGADVAAATDAIVATASAATNPTTIKIASTAATTASYTVTAFLDANNNGAVDTGELSTAQTINFVKVADSGLAVALTKPSLSSTALAATVSFAADVNVAQLTAAKYKVGFGLYGSTGVLSATAAGVAIATGNVTATSKNTAVTALTSAGTAAALPQAGATYNAQAFYDDAATTFVAVGSAVTQVVGTVEANTVTALAPVTTDDVKLNTGTTFNVRAGKTSTALVATVKKNTSSTDATQIAVGAGVTVNVTVSGLTLATASGATSADTITVNGAAVTAAIITAGTYATTATTDASGKVSIPVVTSAGTANDQITVTVTVPNGTAGITASATVVWVAAALTAPVDLIVGSATHTIVKGAAVSASYALRDGYNALYTGSAYRLKVTAAGTGTSAVSTTVYVPFVNGLAAISFTDGSTAAGTYSTVINLEKNTLGSWATDGTLGADYGFAVKVLAAAQVAATATATATEVATGKGAEIDLAGVYVSGNTATASNSVVAPVVTTGNGNTIAGLITDASGVGVAGAQVTVAAAGVQFNSGSLWAIGSITVNADATGSYTVIAYSHTSGKVTYTVTSGAATKTVAVTYAVVASTAGTVLTLTAPATVLPGRTLTVTGLLVDKFGNPVDTTTGTDAGFTVDYDGPGLVVGSDITATSSTGTFTLRVLLGAADSGTATVTATYGGVNGTISSSDTGANIDIVKTATITIGAAAVVAPKAAVIATKNGRVYVTVNTPAGFRAAVKVGFSQKPAFRTTGSNLVSYYVGAGKRVAVVVTVRGGIVASQAITIK